MVWIKHNGAIVKGVMNYNAVGRFDQRVMSYVKPQQFNSNQVNSSAELVQISYAGIGSAFEGGL